MKKQISKITNRFSLRLAAVVLLGSAIALPAHAAGDSDSAALPPPAETWGFNGPLGKFDRAALQRGYQVYREVCAACHGMKYVAFRNLSQDGGPEFSEDEVKALAAEFIIEDGPDEFGDNFDRPGRPSDYFPEPYRNANEARASNGGAFPPDLSLITKARAHGPDYLYKILTGYTDAPAGLEMSPGMEYNPYFSGRQIAMPQPLFEDMVEYADGTPATLDRMSRDLVEFLTWAAEPELEARKGLAIPALLYLAVLTILLYLSYKKIWRNVSKD